MSTKKCTKCEKELSLDSFWKAKQTSDGLRSHCKVCMKAQNRKYCSENKERVKKYNKKFRTIRAEYHTEYQKQYRKTHKEKTAIYKQRYYSKNREAVIAWQKRYYHMHKVEIAAHQKRYYHMHKVEMVARVKRYNQTTAGRLVNRAHKARRRAQKEGSHGSYTAKELQEQLARQKHKCYYCKAKLGKKRSTYHADHIVPLSKGGTNYIDNIVLTCPPCNLKKGNKLLHEWLDAGRLF